MIDAWTWPAYVGIPFGIGFFLLTLVPVVVLQSRRLGRLSTARLIGIAAFSVYLTTLAFYTLFPLPGPDWCAVHFSPPVQTTPLHSLDEIVDAIDGLSTSQAVRHVAVLQVAFNVLLFVPFGLLVRRVFELGRLLTVVAAFGLSVLIEAIQGTGAFGLVGCAYRVADVDDVLTNTLGAVVGVLLAPLVLRWIPHADRLAEQRGEPHPVTRRRRLAAMAVDLFIALAVSGVLTIGYRSVAHYVLGHRLPGTDDWFNQAVPMLVGLGCVIVPCLVGTHASWGQRALWLRPDGPALGTLVRPWLGVGGFMVLLVVSVLPPVVGTTASGFYGATATVLAAVSGLAVILDTSARGLSFRMTHVRIVDSRSEA